MPTQNSSDRAVIVDRSPRQPIPKENKNTEQGDSHQSKSTSQKILSVSDHWTPNPKMDQDQSSSWSFFISLGKSMLVRPRHRVYFSRTSAKRDTFSWRYMGDPSLSGPTNSPAGMVRILFLWMWFFFVVDISVFIPPPRFRLGKELRNCVRVVSGYYSEMLFFFWQG